MNKLELQEIEIVPFPAMQQKYYAQQTTSKIVYLAA